MKARELIEKLSKLDPELEVMCYYENEKLLTDWRPGFLILEIDGVDMVRGEHSTRGGRHDFKFSKAPEAGTMVLINLASET